jgi:hypothetical protein
MTYGCYNRDDFKSSLKVQTGWKCVYVDGSYTRIPVFRDAPNRMTTDCQYSRDTVDTECEGCKRNQRNAVEVV